MGRIKDHSVWVYRNVGGGQFVVTDRLSTGMTIPDGLILSDVDRDGAVDIMVAAQGRSDEARATEAQFRQAWSHATIAITASAF